jgi:hypothetical protein
MKMDKGRMKAYGFLLLLVLITGCHTTVPDVATNFDPMTGARTDLLSGNMLETPQNPPREVVWLNADKIYDAWNRRTKLYLQVDYMAKADTGFLEIPVGTSLILNVDGREMKFTGNGSFNKRNSREKGFVNETALYEISRMDFRTIANAKHVKVQIKGNKGIVERDFAPDNFRRFQEFLARTG